VPNDDDQEKILAEIRKVIRDGSSSDVPGSDVSDEEHVSYTPEYWDDDDFSYEEREKKKAIEVTADNLPAIRYELERMNARLSSDLQEVKGELEKLHYLLINIHTFTTTLTFTNICIMITGIVAALYGYRDFIAPLFQ